MEDFVGWLINESNSTRYSVEINYRTNVDEVLANYAKISLGYASAGLKKADYHVKQVFDDNLPRIMVSARNWDDGTWCTVVSWNPHHKCYFISKGFFRKDTKTISKQGDATKCSATNAADIVREVKNIMHRLKDKPDRHIAKMKKVPLKRGPQS